MGIADLGLKPHAVFKFLIGHVGQVSRIQLCLEQFLIIAEAHLVFLRVHPINEHGLAQGKAQALSLANGIMDKPFMLPNDPACHIHKIAGGPPVAAFPFDEGGVIAVGDEADILAVAFFGNKSVYLFRNFAHFLLGKFPNGKKHSLQLLLRQSV